MANLTQRQWNRTVLGRQFLLHRVDEDAVEVLDRTVGMQSQDPQAAFYGLFARIADFDPAEVDQLLTERELVRVALFRSTVFLIDAAEARWLRPLVQPVLDAEVRHSHAPRLQQADPRDVAAAGMELLRGTELSSTALGKTLAQQWPDEPPSTLTAVVRCLVPLVQVPPRGLWRRGAAATYQLFDDWCGPGEPPLTGDEAKQDLIRLYLRGFGPATISAITRWSGLTNLTPIVEAMEADWELCMYTGPDGEKLYDIEGVDVATGDEDAPVRLLAPYDNLVVAQEDRRRVVDDDVITALATPNGRSPGFILVDGRVVGSWNPPTASRPTIEPTYFVPVAKSAQLAVDDEIDKLRSAIG